MFSPIGARLRKRPRLTYLLCPSVYLSSFLALSASCLLPVDPSVCPSFFLSFFLSFFPSALLERAGKKSSPNMVHLWFPYRLSGGVTVGHRTVAPPSSVFGLLTAPRLALQIGFSAPRRYNGQCMKTSLPALSTNELTGTETGGVCCT